MYWVWQLPKLHLVERKLNKYFQVNGHDLTLATHKKAVEYIGRKTVLNMIVYRKGMPQLQQQRSANVPPRQPVYDQQRTIQQPIYQSQQQYPPTSSYSSQPSGQSRYPPQMSAAQLSNSRPYWINCPLWWRGLLFIAYVLLYSLLYIVEATNLFNNYAYFHYQITLPWAECLYIRQVQTSACSMIHHVV